MELLFPGSTGAGQPPSSAPTSGGAASELAIKKLELKDGRVAVGSTTSPKQNVYDELNLEASDVSLNSQFPLRLSAKLPGGGSLKLDGKAGPVDRTDASLTPVNAKLAISGLDLARTGFLDPASGIAGMVDLNSDISSADGTAKAKGTLKLDKFQMAKGGSPAGTPINVDFDSNYDLRRSAGTLNSGVVKIGNAVAHLAGTFETQGDSTRLNLKLNAQNMPVKDLRVRSARRRHRVAERRFAPAGHAQRQSQLLRTGGQARHHGRCRTLQRHARGLRSWVASSPRSLLSRGPRAAMETLRLRS